VTDLDMTTADPIVRQVHIKARPETVFPFFTEADKLCRWLADTATLDARPGGECRQIHLNGGKEFAMVGEFVEVEPHSRVVFTWGYDDPALGVAPGTSIVEVTLRPEGDGTDLRLEHRLLPTHAVPAHSGGWTAMLDRLTVAVEKETDR
jgi:uncharacterized protein YndB with AHSA1/START domain